jgi:steroid 5-alpha reductase family enzyme
MIRLLLFAFIIGSALFVGLYDFSDDFASASIAIGGLKVILGILTGLWLLSLWLKDSSIVDIFWGIGFVVLAWYYRNQIGDNSYRTDVIVWLVTLWGLRLGLYLGYRNIGKGEDYRYATWRKESGSNWWWVSFLRVFVLQGVIMWVVASPILIALSSATLTWLDWLGGILWGIGLLFETIGDWQLMVFKKNPANQGKVMNKGLWGLTRHPNYFGDAVVWWGFFCFAASVGGWFYVFSPVLMTFLLMKVSGVAMLEKTLTQTKPQYAEYIKRVPAFFPKLW